MAGTRGIHLLLEIRLFPNWLSCLQPCDRAIGTPSSGTPMRTLSFRTLKSAAGQSEKTFESRQIEIKTIPVLCEKFIRIDDVIDEGFRRILPTSSEVRLPHLNAESPL